MPVAPPGPVAPVDPARPGKSIYQINHIVRKKPDEMLTFTVYL